MEPTDEENHATNPPSEDEIHSLCKKTAYRYSDIPMGSPLSETVQLYRAAVQSQTR